MGGDAQALRQLFQLAKPLGFRHRSCRDIAHRDIAALGDELAREFAAHARAAPGDNGDLSGKILHGGIADLSGILAGSETVAPSLVAQATEILATQMLFQMFSRGCGVFRLSNNEGREVAAITHWRLRSRR